MMDTVDRMWIAATLLIWGVCFAGLLILWLRSDDASPLLFCILGMCASSYDLLYSIMETKYGGANENTDLSTD